MRSYNLTFLNDDYEGIYFLNDLVTKRSFIYIPHGSIKEAMNIEDIKDKDNGIYLLYGEYEVYAGQTSRGLQRVLEHETEAYWDCAFVMLDFPQTCTLNLISCLERDAIVFLQNKKFRLHNSQTPKYKSSDYVERQNAKTILNDFWFFVNLKNVIRIRSDFDPLSTQEIVSNKPTIKQRTPAGKPESKPPISSSKSPIFFLSNYSEPFHFGPKVPLKCLFKSL